jgi:septum formation protein
VAEIQEPGEAPNDFALRIARKKVVTAIQQLDNDITPILGADTIVVLDKQILQKPLNKDDALGMLSQLSGRSHEVITAVAVSDGLRQIHTATTTTKVQFRILSEKEILDYWDSGEPMDKAGAYAIQGQGAVFVERIEGSYSGVVGLPLFETYQLLLKAAG